MKTGLLFPILLLCTATFAKQYPHAPAGWTDAQVTSVSADGLGAVTIGTLDGKTLTLKPESQYKSPEVSGWQVGQTVRYQCLGDSDCKVYNLDRMKPEQIHSTFYPERKDDYCDARCESDKELETHPESLPGNCALQFRLAERQN